jgi:membrane carboxypeptidase/penicillin-binding protein
MPSVPRILAQRRRRAVRPAASRTGLGCSALASLVLVLLAILAAFFYADLTRNLPPVETLVALLDPPDGLLLQPTQIYDRNGVHILTLQNRAAQDRQYLHYLRLDSQDTSILPLALIQSTLAASDPDFWAHPGFPIPGLHRTSHPTLAQHLVSDLLLADEPASLRRTLRQDLLAAQITSRYGRGKILEWYLNSAYYGHLAFGADAAARLYFNKSAAQLDLAEAAMLAGVAESPNLNPFDAPQEALARQKGIIQKMLQYRLIQPEEGLDAAGEELNLRPAAPDQWAFDLVDFQAHPAYLELVLQQIQTQIPLRRLERGGLRILTTLDSDLQLQATCAVQIQQTRLQNLPVPADSASCPAALLLPALPDSIAAPANLQTDLVVLDPLTGQVLALVGAPPIDLAGSVLPDRPGGSLSTPWIYLTAFTRGLSPASLVWDIPGASQAVTQELTSQYHGPLRLRIAMANDYLNPAQSVLELVGVQNVRRTLQQFGLLKPGAVLPSGAPAVQTILGETDLLSVSQALGTLANQGVWVGRVLPGDAQQVSSGPPPALHPIAALRVEEQRSGLVWLDWGNSQIRPILTAQLAYLLTNVLSDEPARWPSLGHPNPLEIGRPAAAKLAQNADGSSQWAVGYTPQRVVGVWLGFKPSLDVPNASHADLSQAAAGLWNALMKYATRDLPYQPWNIPAGISTLQVCDPSGMLPTPSCPNLVDEVFADGNEPVQTDTLYRSVPLNRQTGRLATVFTPPDLVEPRVFLIPPPEAQAWAQAANLEMPPEVYDTIPLDIPHWPGAIITSPTMFTILRDQVKIRGTADGENFASFRVQAGQGLDPQRWLQIGPDVHTPMKDGLLTIWDTSGLNGLYAIQLLVVQQDQSLLRTTLLVTLDNTPPQVQITYPANAAEISASRDRIIFQVDARDETGLQSVTFYVDGALLSAFTQAPYAAGWQVSPGTHRLRVVAADQSGNTSETSIEFSVK